MSFFFSWYFLITILGWLSFPLAHTLFPNFADRGLALSRVLGLLIWSYIFWIFTSIGISQNDISGIILALAILLAVSTYLFVHRRSDIVNFLKANISLLITVELLFLMAFIFLAVVRAANPEILGTEKPMELAFINAVMRSPTFPPRDPWLSGYAISYYHFGYIITAMLAKVTSTPGTLAFNLMISLVFALGALGAYGLLYDLLSSANKIENRKYASGTMSVVGSPLLAPFFLLIVSNIEGLFHIFYTRGLFRNTTFWAWLNLQDMTTSPALPISPTLDSVPCNAKSVFICSVESAIQNFLLPIRSEIATWIPTQFWWWWRASRVVYDSDLMGNHQEVIDEFPFFSFLLGDLHPHVLAIPFGLLAIAFAYHVYLGASHATMEVRGIKLHLSPVDLVLASLILGGLSFLNTWDILIVSALMIGAYVLSRVNEAGWNLSRVEDGIIFALPLAFIAYILFLPFHVSFSSQAGGLFPNLINPTRGTHLWMMFAPLFVPIFVYLYTPPKQAGRKVNWLLALYLSIGFVLFLWGFSWLLAQFAQFKDPVFALQYLHSQGVANIAEFFRAASLRKLQSLAGLLTLLAILLPAIAHLTSLELQSPSDEEGPTPSPASFILFMILLAALLVLGPEFLYLRDQFGTRMNTIFKFYYQAWMLWSIAAAYGVVIVLRELQGRKGILYRLVLAIVLFSALIYPVLSILNKTNNFRPFFGYTLNDFDRVERENPDEAAALKFLQSAPDGVVAEAVGGSYSSYARVSTYTGLPTVLGWPGHESQWRGGGDEQGSRQQDIETLYNTNSWETAQEIIQKYGIRYIYIGDLERSSLKVQEEKFSRHLSIAFQSNTVIIYQTTIQ